jgi:hypothetical protein
MKASSFIYESFKDYYSTRVRKLWFLFDIFILGLAIYNGVTGFQGNLSSVLAGLGWLFAGFLLVTNDFAVVIGNAMQKDNKMLKMAIEQLLNENERLRKDVAWPAEVAAKEK